MFRKSITLIWGCTLAVSLAACTQGGSPVIDGGQDDAGLDGGLGYRVMSLDSTPSELQPLSLSVGPQDQVGVAYFQNIGNASDPVRNYQIKYVQWQNNVATTPSVVQTVQNVYGVSVAFQNSGVPAVAYLGGFKASAGIAWPQSEAVVAYQQLDRTWQEDVAVIQPGEASAGSDPGNAGHIVGLYPSLLFNLGKAYLSYRDVHFGQNATDWSNSNLELASGGPGNDQLSGGPWIHDMIAAGPTVSSGIKGPGYGGHTQIIWANGQPAVVSDQLIQGGGDNGQNALFTLRQANGIWGVPTKIIPSADTQGGPSVAYDSTYGFGAVAVDRGPSALYYNSSVDGLTWLLSPEAVFQSGTGGWYPSLAIDPIHHQPAISFYLCALGTGVAEGSCPTAEDELKISYRNSNGWQHQTVDTNGGVRTRLAFLSTGKAVIVYRDPHSGAIQLAVQN